MPSRTKVILFARIDEKGNHFVQYLVDADADKYKKELDKCVVEAWPKIKITKKNWRTIECHEIVLPKLDGNVVILKLKRDEKKEVKEEKPKETKEPEKPKEPELPK